MYVGVLSLFTLVAHNDKYVFLLNKMTKKSLALGVSLSSLFSLLSLSLSFPLSPCISLISLSRLLSLLTQRSLVKPRLQEKPTQDREGVQTISLIYI